jgi:hypothetical protein
MKDFQQLQEIAVQLNELQRTSPINRADLADWDTKARKFSRDLCVQLPSQVTHYLHDADLRIKNEKYRSAQDEMISNIISDLERGIIPQSAGTTIFLSTGSG